MYMMMINYSQFLEAEKRYSRRLQTKLTTPVWFLLKTLINFTFKAHIQHNIFRLKFYGPTTFVYFQTQAQNLLFHFFVPEKALSRQNAVRKQFD